MVWLEGEGGDGGAAHLPSPPSLSHPDPVVTATAVWPSLSLSLPDPAKGRRHAGGRKAAVGGVVVGLFFSANNIFTGRWL